MTCVYVYGLCAHVNVDTHTDVYIIHTHNIYRCRYACLRTSTQIQWGSSHIIYIFIYLFIYLYIYIYISIYIFIYLFLSFFVYFFVCLFVCLFAYLFIYMCVCICLSIHVCIYSFERWRKPLCTSLLTLLVFRAVFRAASATTVSASADDW